MKNWLFITVMVVFFTLSSTTSWSIENPAIRNPAGLSTVPPSSIQSGLISNPNPIDTSGNLLITGNVRRGMHFRGTVPYGSTTSFRAGLGSSSLSSFLRDSAGAEDFGRYANGYSIQPYYLQSQTVTTSMPGYSGVFRPIGTRTNGRALQVQYPTGMKTTNGQEKQAYSGWDTLAQLGTSRESSESGLQRLQTQYGTSAKPRQIVQSIRELQLLTQDEAGKSPQDQQLMIERYQKQTQDTRLKTQEPEFKTEDLGTALEQRYVVSSPEHKQSQVAEIVQSTRPDFSAEVLTPGQADAVVKPLAFKDRANLQKVAGWESQAVEVKIDEHGRDQQGQRDRLGSDVLERIKQQLDDLTRSVDDRLETGTEEERKDKSIKTDTASSSRVTMIDWGKMRRSYAPEKAPSGQSADEQEVYGLELPEAIRPESSPLDELNKLSHAELAAKAKRIREPYTNPESYSEAKFNQHIQAAENYLKTGRYYRAADSFALASIYKLDDPLCFAGRGHALFAAGEYVSSALFLSRALEIAPEYARTKIDFAVMLGGEDKLENRIADIKEWLGKSGSGQLEFLLGYVYYQMGRLGPAKQAINAASEKMPKSTAIDILKKAIDDKITG
jgi:tetratricopeptide (TPR) repeat protein